MVGTPDARKRACPVWGALGGNLRLKGCKAPSFDSMSSGGLGVLPHAPQAS